MNTSATVYQASGRIGAGAFLKILLIGVPIAFVCAAIYAVVIRYNPFVYFSFLATIVFGLALGMTAVSTAQAGKSRSLPFNLAAALFIALVGLWAQWLVWLSLHDGGTQIARGLAGQGPGAWSDFFVQLADNYQLSIGRARRSSSAVMDSSSMLWIWRVEALATVLLALVASWALTRERVFCEETGRWAEKDGQLVLEAASVAPATLLEAADRGDYSLLTSLPAATPPAASEPRTIFVVTLTHEPSCSQCRLIQVESGKDSLDDKGKLKRAVTSLVSTRFVPADVYARLAARRVEQAADARAETADPESAQS